MYKYVVKLSFCLLLFTSCSNNNDNKTLEFEYNDYAVHSDDELFHIIKNDDAYTLESLHNYYEKIKVTRSDQLNYNNLRKLIISLMYKEKGLASIDDKVMIEYYVNEIISMPYVHDMEMFYFLLTSLKGHWTNNKIGNTAKLIVNRNYKYINDNFDNPQEILDLPHQSKGSYSLSNLFIFAD